MEKPKVFLSWSGERSRQVALVLRDWLPTVLQFVDPFVSSEDIQKGQNWNATISKQLESSNVGIFCLTPENLSAEWILFEAGALSKHTGDARVNCFLIGLRKADLRPPLSLFQATEVEKEDVRKLVASLNAAAGEWQIPHDTCDKSFDRGWGELESALKSKSIAQTPDQDAAPVRSDRELLEEVLALLREQSRRGSSDAATPEELVFLGMLARKLDSEVRTLAEVAIREMEALTANGGEPGIDDRWASFLRRMAGDLDGRLRWHSTQLVNATASYSSPAVPMTVTIVPTAGTPWPNQSGR